jgi:hypothetical protein
MLKTSFTFVVVVTLATAAFADSKRPWLHTPDDFWSRTFGPTQNNFSPRYYASPGYYASPSYVAQSQVESRRAYSFEPAPTLKAGDSTVVAKNASEMKIGNRVIANLVKGTQATVLAVQGNWIGVRIDRNGQKVDGWVAASDFTAGTPGANR